MKRANIPKGMLDAATEVARDIKLSVLHQGGREADALAQIKAELIALPILEAAILWLDDVLHESNVDFHRAILKRGAERYTEQNSGAFQRVAFEFGASFARQYIRSLFHEPASVDAATGKIIAEARQRAFDEIMACAKDEDIEAGIGVDAERVWALALQEREKHKNDPPKAIRHLICKPDGAWPPSRQLYNACIEDAYEIGKESREP